MAWSSLPIFWKRAHGFPRMNAGRPRVQYPSGCCRRVRSRCAHRICDVRRQGRYWRSNTPMSGNCRGRTDNWQFDKRATSPEGAATQPRTHVGDFCSPYESWRVSTPRQFRPLGSGVRSHYEARDPFLSHCTFILAALMMGHHFSISALWKASRPSGVCCSRDAIS